MPIKANSIFYLLSMVIKVFCCCLRLRLFQLLSGGIVRKWADDMLTLSRIKGSYSQAQAESDEGSPEDILDLNDLQGAFIVLGIGLMVATVAWLIELFLYKICKLTLVKRADE
jgi:hypothetical protein